MPVAARERTVPGTGCRTWPMEVIAVTSESPISKPGSDGEPGGTSPNWGSPPGTWAGEPPGAWAGEPVGDLADARRAEAIQRLQKKRGWMSGFVAYVVVNAFLVGIWATTGRGYFWPGWVLGGWGVGMVLSFWDIYVRRPISESDIAEELRRHGRA